MGSGGGGGCGSGGGAVAGGVLAGELCAPLLLLCWLCCWPDDSKSDSSSNGNRPRKPVVAKEGRHGRSSKLSGGSRLASSAVSLHLPSTSGKKDALCAHRSHEEIRPHHRRRSHHLEPTGDTRYHSAPSVIHEVVHRRDWERSTKELHIPLRSPNDTRHESDASDDSPNTSDQRPETIDRQNTLKPCKKHHTNIKTSTKHAKELTRRDVKDEDATELAPTNSFYIGEEADRQAQDSEGKTLLKAKKDKQSLNESIRCKERPWPAASMDSRELLGRQTSLFTCISRNEYPPPSTEPVGYEGGACYLAETGSVSSLRRPAAPAAAPASPAPSSPALSALRSRHASDGDILGPAPRPESGAFSESDLDLDVDSLEERPPEYDELELQEHTHSHRKETAI